MKNRRNRSALSSRACCILIVLLIACLAGCGPADEGANLTPTAAARPTRTPAPTAAPSPTPVSWAERLPAIRWVAYSPTNADPDRGIEPSVESMRLDLAALRRAGFTGLVTYSASGTAGQALPELAEELGFDGLIIGIWDPASSSERSAAIAAAKNPIVLGYCVGNEGLNKRYELAALSAAIDELKAATGKPVTTTEEIDDYSDEALLALGDWVFPNAHPYFHNQIDPLTAVEWTAAAYADMQRRAQRLVIFKEVGLPTAGNAFGQLSEENQASYYQQLAKTEVNFVYFEGFDQIWKTTLPIEPYWGIFRADRSPKLLAYALMGEPPVPTPTAADPDFTVYRDMDFSGNHFSPSGYMGDTGDIRIDRAWTENPHSGATSIQITYTAEGKESTRCGGYRPPCKWAGVYWQEPPNNWGTNAVWQGQGYDLSGYRRVAFWARADAPVRVEFKVGGIIGAYGDSLAYPRGILAALNGEWQEFEIDLEGADLSHIIGGFAWVATWEECPGGAVFYLDDIRFVK